MPDEKKKDEEKPSGGLDKTPLHPSQSTTYTVKITFHSASNIPVSDFGKRSSDPYLLAQLNAPLPTRHKQDPYLRYRTPTVHRKTEPAWESSWIIAGIPERGFEMKVRLYDEDPQDHDDRLGRLEYHSGTLNKGYKREKMEQKFKTAKSDWKAYGLRWCTKMTNRDQRLHPKLVYSVEVLGKTEEEVGKAYTINCFWFTHQSPMIGKLAGTKANDHDGVEKADFQANEFQLQGPIPNELYHRYVEFKPFVKGMFTGTGFRGALLNKALHHQHTRIYNFAPDTKYGSFEKPSEEMTMQFLKMVHFDKGGRIFTYVLTLDAMFRFTETGKEFGIDLLSKHTMHSDVNIYIAWSGEFFIRRLKNPKKSDTSPDQEMHPPKPVEGGPPEDQPPQDPEHYELVIDNDSGTYRPDKSLLPKLKEFLEKNFVGLRIKVMACDDEKLQKLKDAQREVKKKEGKGMVYGQGNDSSSSLSSSDVSDLEQRAEAYGNDDENGNNEGVGKQGKIGKAVGVVEDPKAALKGVLPGK